MTAIPEISVILPTYNRTDELPRSIGSVLRQSFGDLELIVVDDGSTEDVRNAVARFADPRIRYVRLDTRRGVAAARNAGLTLARGRYVAFQDSDDEWLLEKLRLQREVMQARAGRDLVVCDLFRIRGRSVTTYPVRVAAHDRIKHAEILASSFAYCQTWLVRRDVLEAEGPFDEALRNWSDWEMLIRLSRRVVVTRLPRALVVSPQKFDSLTVVNPQWLSAIEHIRRKHASSVAGQPAAEVALRYTHARLLAAAGRLADARRELLRNLPHLHWRSAAVFAASLGGRSLLARALRMPIKSAFGP